MEHYSETTCWKSNPLVNKWPLDVAETTPVELPLAEEADKEWLMI